MPPSPSWDSMAYLPSTIVPIARWFGIVGPIATVAAMGGGIGSAGFGCGGEPRNGLAENGAIGRGPVCRRAAQWPQ